MCVEMREVMRRRKGLLWGAAGRLVLFEDESSWLAFSHIVDHHFSIERRYGSSASGK